MADQTAEEAAHAYARAVVGGDMQTILRYLTPDALAKLMRIMGHTYFKYFSYELAAQGPDGDDRLVDVTYQTELGPVRFRYRLHPTEGAWKIGDIEGDLPMRA